MAADDQAGSASGGIDHLERVITNQCEKLLLSDRETASADKLNSFAPDFESWVSSEPNLVLTDCQKLSDVTRHSSFGRIKAKIMVSCCCGTTLGSQSGTGTAVGVTQPKTGTAVGVTQPNPQCSLHSPEVQLHDLVFEIAQAVHQVFNDNWICFVHVLQDRSESGGVGVWAPMYERFVLQIIYIDISVDVRHVKT